MAYTIYDPRLVANNNQYKAKYPALKEYPDIDALTPDWAVFCWWYACEASPLVVTPMSSLKRSELAIIKAGLSKYADDSDVKAVLSGQIPPHIKKGCDAFASFDVALNTRAYKMACSMFEANEESVKPENYMTRKVVKTRVNGKGVPMDEEVIEYEIDYQALQKVQSMVAASNPQLIRQMQSEYGVAEIDDTMLTLGADELAKAFFESKIEL